MEERNRNNEQNSNRETLTNLKRLREIASQQNREDFVSALNKAIEALSGDEQGEDKSDGLRLSSSASDVLDNLSQQVRNTTLSPSQRTAAAQKLVRFGGGR